MSKGIFGTFRSVLINTLASVDNVALASNIATAALPVHASQLHSDAITELTKTNPELATQLKLDITKLLE